MRHRTKWIAGSAVLVAVVGTGIGTGIAAATGGDSETPITGDALQRASAAALAYTGGGKITGTEVGDEESYYQVEVTRSDGSQVDVQLDQNFAVLTSKADHEDGNP